MERPLPTVSVLTTCYNREAYIAETIESVLAQTFADFEYIIVDDCSTDRSFEIAQSYAANDSRIRLYRNDSNLGDYPNRSKAASYAKGQYLKYIDSDDLLYSHALAVFVSHLESQRDCALALAKNNFASRPMPIKLLPEEALLAEVTTGGVLGNAPGSVMIRKSAFDAVGGFSGKNLIGDYELWLRIACLFPVLLVPGHTGWDRRHDAQESNVDPVEYLKKRLDVLEQVLRLPEAAAYGEARSQFSQRLSLGKSRCVYQFLKRGAIGKALAAKRSLDVSTSELIRCFWPWLFTASRERGTPSFLR